jgi:hypothetical protein
LCSHNILIDNMLLFHKLMLISFCQHISDLLVFHLFKIIIFLIKITFFIIWFHFIIFLIHYTYLSFSFYSY